MDVIRVSVPQQNGQPRLWLYNYTHLLAIHAAYQPVYNINTQKKSQSKTVKNAFSSCKTL